MRQVYPFLKRTKETFEFYDGEIVKLPKEYLKISNRKVLNDFYENVVAKTADEIVFGTDPLGFDYIHYKNKVLLGLILGLSNSSSSNRNKKKYPSNRFSKEYIFKRVYLDYDIFSFKKFIPINVIKQNIHELRNLNMKISSSVDQILNYSEPDEWERKFDESDDNIKKIYVGSRLIKFILDNIKFYDQNYFSEISIKKDKSFIIHRSVSKIVKIYNNDFKVNKTSIEFSGRCNKSILGQKEYFEIVLMLLIENSLKYSIDKKKLPPKVKIATIKNQVYITVESYGSLIPEDEEDRIFSRGFRASSNNKIVEGTGMGLYTATRLIKLFGGEIVYSRNTIVEDNNLGWNVFSILCNDTI